MTDEAWQQLDARARAVLELNDGVAKLSSFLAVDISGKQAGALTGRGVLDRPRSGWYCDPSLPWQAKCAIRVGGVLTCVSAVDSFGLPTPNPGRRHVHVLVPSNSARRRHNRDRRHYVVPGEDREVEMHWSSTPGTLLGWRVDLVEALLQLADCVPEDWWIAALDAARHVPVTDDRSCATRIGNASSAACRGASGPRSDSSIRARRACSSRYSASRCCGEESRSWICSSGRTRDTESTS